MQSIVIGALVIAYICVAYIGPVVAFGLAGYWAYQSVQTGGTMGGAFVTFVMSALVMPMALTGNTALSVLKQTTVLTPAAWTRSVQFTVLASITIPHSIR